MCRLVRETENYIFVLNVINAVTDSFSSSTLGLLVEQKFHSNDVILFIFI